MPVAQTYDEGRSIIAERRLERRKHQIAQQRGQTTDGGVVADPVLPQRPRAGEPGHYESYGEQREEYSRSARDAQLLPAVDRHIGGDHAVAEGETHHRQSFAPALEQEEAVEREHALLGLEVSRRKLDGGVDKQSRQRYGHGEPEKRVEIPLEGLQHVDRQHRSEGGRQVVAESVVAYALASARRGEHVDGHGARGHRGRPERRSVEGPEYREHGQASGHDIAEEEQEKEETAHHEHGLARVIVHYISAEQPDDQSHQRIPGQGHAYCVVGRPESVAQIERKQRHDQGEREIQQKVSRPYLEIVAVPEFICHRLHSSLASCGRCHL